MVLPPANVEHAPMSMHSQQNHQILDEYDLSAGPATASEHFKERELARRSHLLLVENAEWLKRNSDKLVSSSRQS
jgi:hypothetical protein